MTTRKYYDSAHGPIDVQCPLCSADKGHKCYSLRWANTPDLIPMHAEYPHRERALAYDKKIAKRNFWR